MGSNQASVSKSESRYIVIYDGDCNFCVKCMGLLRLLDFSRKLKYTNFRTKEFARRNRKFLKRLEDEMLLLAPSGEQYWGYFTWKKMTTLLPLLWISVPFLYIPGVDLVGEWAYAFVSRNRNRWGCKSCKENKHNHLDSWF